MALSLGIVILERSRSTRQRKRRRNNRIDHHYQRERHGDTLSPCWAEGIAIDSCQRLSRPSSAPAGATPTLLGQRRVRGTDRSLRDATHSHNDITAKMPRKMPNRTIASLLRSSLVIEECSGLAVACAAAAAGLHSWAFHRTVRTEDTAVAGFGFEPDTAAGAVPEEYARVCRHRIRFPQAALRAGDGGFPHRVHIP